MSEEEDDLIAARQMLEDRVDDKLVKLKAMMSLA
jgi:hypothetical protein